MKPRNSVKLYQYVEATNIAQLNEMRTMLYTKEMIDAKCPNECWRNVDFCCIDKSGHIAFVGSGGGLIPTSVEKTTEYDLAIIKNYFDSLPVITDQVIFLEPFTNDLKLLPKTLQDVSIQNVTATVSRGIYIYCKKRDLYEDFEFEADARPGLPLTIHDIDKKILTLIEKTFVNINFETDNSFYVNEVT